MNASDVEIILAQWSMIRLKYWFRTFAAIEGARSGKKVNSQTHAWPEPKIGNLFKAIRQENLIV